MSPEPCNFQFCELLSASSPERHPNPKKRAIIPFTRFMYLRAPQSMEKVESTLRKMKQKPATPRGPITEGEILNLQPGEWVEVLSEEEIKATLNEHGRYRGLGVMPEMLKFCGQRFKVFKIVRNIIMEQDGEMRHIKMPTVYLEGVYCDGEFHEGCERSCFCLWREGWLKRAPLADQGSNAD